MDQNFVATVEAQIEELKKNGLYKKERVISSPQSSKIKLESGKEVLNLCANNYLGLADHPSLIEAAIDGLQNHGFGLASVRFICGTQDIHKELERRIASFLETEDTILYSSCFDANGGLFECFLGEEDAIISDSLNHASIIDGIRLSKAERRRYAHNDMSDLEKHLKETQDKRYRLIATDGVFSMDGTIANLGAIVSLAEKYKALVMVDECHATGFLGNRGKGAIEHCNVLGKVDFITGTLGKALGGASGGFVSGKAPLIDWLRQKSRPYLFSNSLMPAIVQGSLKVFDLIEKGSSLREKLHYNSRYFRDRMTSLGFNLLPGGHPIIPVMLGDAKLASTFADQMLEEGVYVISFSYPVVPHGKARIRTQMSAALEQEDLDLAIHAFQKVGQKLGVIP